MSSSKFNDWLTISANIAVLLGLVVLIFEIRANTAAMVSQEWGSITEQNLMANEFDTETNSIYIKALYSLDELSIDELRIYITFISNRISALNRAYIAYQNGLAKPEDWEYLLSQVPVYLGTKSGKIMWDELRNDYNRAPGLVKEIDRALAESEIIPDDQWYIELQEKIRESN
jgi:hypothetical protein